jgi:hypothetical protein
LLQVLGCDRFSSIEQVVREYKVRARQLHPDYCSAPDASKQLSLSVQYPKPPDVFQYSLAAASTPLLSLFCIPSVRFVSQSRKPFLFATRYLVFVICTLKPFAHVPHLFASTRLFVLAR